MIPRIPTYVGFATIVVLGVAFGLLVHSRPGLPSLKLVMTRRWAVRVLALLFWAFVGWHLFVRGSGAFK